LLRIKSTNSKYLHILRPISAGRSVVFLATGVLGVLGDLLILSAIKHFGPELVAFLANGSIVAVFLIGVIQGEKPGLARWLSALLTISGAFLFAYKGGQIQWGSIGLMVLACLSIAGKQTLLGRILQDGFRIEGMALFCLVCSLLLIPFSWPQIVSLHAIPTSGPWIVAAAIASFSGLLLLLRAYSTIGITIAAPIDSLRPLAVAGISFFIGGISFGHLQYAGSIIILVGSLMLIATEKREVELKLWGMKRGCDRNLNFS